MTQEEQRLREENEELKNEIRELRETLDAISAGEVDAIVVSKDDEKKVYTLENADLPYRILIENIREGALTLSRDGMILYGNTAFASMRGLPLSEIIGTNLRDHIAPRDMDHFNTLLNDAISVPVRSEMSICSGNGAFPVVVSMTALDTDGDRKISAVVTDRRKDYDRLLLQGRMLDSVADAVIAADPSGKVIYWNDAATRTYGWHPEEVIGHDLISISVPEISLEDSRNILDRLMKGETWSGEYTVRHRDGHTFPIHAMDAPVFDDNGCLVAVVGASHDISERRRVEKALRESEERFRELGEKAGSIIVRYDTNGNITYFNEFAQQLFGFTLEEILGKPAVGTIIPATESTGRDLSLMVRDLVANPEKYANNENENMCKNGERVWVRWTNKPIYNMDGTIREFLGIGNDISERKKTEDALQRGIQKLVILAESSRMLLTSETPEQIVQAICDRILNYLDCNLFFNYIIEDNKDRMRLNAWAGITDEAARQIEFLDLGASVCGCVGRDGIRIVAEDIQHTHDSKTDLVRSFGVSAYVCHPLIYQGKTIGTLSFGTRKRVRFQDDEIELMHTITDLVATAMARKRAEHELNEALAEREILLSEVHHRVKNNLTAFISLLSLESAYDDSPTGLALKKDLQNRARSMALIHETLYRTKNYSRVNMDVYLSTLVGQVVKSFELARSVKTVVDAHGITLDLSRATPAGLIINELMTNSLKYAFPASFDCETIRCAHCTTEVNLTQDDGAYLLTVRDNGIGLPADLDVGTTKTLGLKLVNFLAKHQLRSSIEVHSDRGTEFRFRFRDKK